MSNRIPDDVAPYVEAVRLEAGRRTGLPEKWAALVRGDTLTEIKVHADELALHYDARMWRANRHLVDGNKAVREI
ncbi:hypothetical protein ACSBQY_10450 [Micrococcus lylae]|uniref:hypothetical protein n=1 Tax=Micrococcus lylae TaxID=1273 RepID=UPI003EC01B6B